MPFVDRDPQTGRIIKRFGESQYQGQELVADDAFEFRIEEKQREIEAAYAASVARGSPYGDGDAIQVDDAYRINISGLASNAGFYLAGVPGFTWPQGGQFLRTLANVNLYLTPQQIVAIAMAVRTCWTEIRERYAALKDACEDAEDIGDLQAIEPAEGWPN